MRPLFLDLLAEFPVARAAAALSHVAKGCGDGIHVATLQRREQRSRLFGRSIASGEETLPVAPYLGFRGVLTLGVRPLGSRREQIGQLFHRIDEVTRAGRGLRQIALAVDVAF